jgi:hypothetical protein
MNFEIPDAPMSMRILEITGSLSLSLKCRRLMKLVGGELNLGCADILFGHLAYNRCD